MHTNSTPFLIILILISSLKTHASSGNPKFYILNFGEAAFITFEPVETNRGWSVAHDIFGNVTIRKPSSVKSPNGFRCGITSKSIGSKKCPLDTNIDDKRNGSPVCLSTVFQLKELCPTEVEDT